jgi:hypothetical protein
LYRGWKSSATFTLKYRVMVPGGVHNANRPHMGDQFLSA